MQTMGGTGLEACSKVAAESGNTGREGPEGMGSDMSRRVDVNTIETDHWTFTWAGAEMRIRPRGDDPCNHHYRIEGDPHFWMDDQPAFDFPEQNCTFVFSDGTVLVAQAPAANAAMRDCHVFASDGQHFTFGGAAPFNEEVGWLFVQQQGSCEFYCTSNKPIKNKNGAEVVPVKYQTL